MTSEETAHHVRSSNLPFYVAVWSTAKLCRGLVGLNKTFDCGDERHGGDAGGQLEKRRQIEKEKRRRNVVVDILAEGGAQWIKLSTVSQSRLLFEMAENGWHEHVSGEEEEGVNEDEDAKLSLLVLAEDLQRAAAANKSAYGKAPKVRLVLPKLELGHVREIDNLLSRIRCTGTEVQCQAELDQPLGSTLDEAMQNMLLDEFADLTPTLNIDCTILLALVSDLSHSTIIIEPSFHVAIRRQIEREKIEQVMPLMLWPAMDDRQLVCTVEAARRMREIVDTIGTPTEKIRTALLMGDHDRTPGKIQDPGASEEISSLTQR